MMSPKNGKIRTRAVFIGPAGAGKTAIREALRGNYTLDDPMDPFITDCDFSGGAASAWSLWDLSGEADYDSITWDLYSHCDIAVFILSAEDLLSENLPNPNIDRLQQQFDIFMQPCNGNEKAKKILVISKSDFLKNISTELASRAAKLADELAKKLQVEHTFYCSVADRDGISELEYFIEFHAKERNAAKLSVFPAKRVTFRQAMQQQEEEKIEGRNLLPEFGAAVVDGDKFLSAEYCREFYPAIYNNLNQYYSSLYGSAPNWEKQSPDKPLFKLYNGIKKLEQIAKVDLSEHEQHDLALALIKLTNNLEGLDNSHIEEFKTATAQYQPKPGWREGLGFVIGALIGIMVGVLVGAWAGPGVALTALAAGAKGAVIGTVLGGTNGALLGGWCGFWVNQKHDRVMPIISAGSELAKEQAEANKAPIIKILQ
jgi:GTPase SAR1 family protein